MPRNFHWIHRIKCPDEYWHDASYPKMPIRAVEPQTIHQTWAHAFLSWRRHVAEHEGVSHMFVFFLANNTEFVTMLGEMNLPLPRVHKRYDSYDTSFVILC